MRLRAWTCPSCKNIIITEGYIQGIGCKCGKMIRLDCKSTKDLIELKYEKKVKEYGRNSTTAINYKNRMVYTIPEEYEIKEGNLLNFLMLEGTQIPFKDVFT